jgi:Caspase domain
MRMQLSAQFEIRPGADRIALPAVEDGYDETLVPLDYATAGQIHDDDLLKHLICKMPSGVTMTCLFDCCHSGTVLDLPYTFVGDGKHESMTTPDNYNFAPAAAAGGYDGDSQEFEDDKNQATSSAPPPSQPPPPKKKSGLFCCFGGR